ncbi:hypothetical protein ACFE04_013474 [Oxalis oulophora]
MFILGNGFVGQSFTQDLKNKGWIVSGTCRNPVKKKQFEEGKGIHTYLFDANANANEPLLELVVNHIRSCTHLVVSIPPLMGVGDPYEDLLTRTLSRGSLQWLCYLSSTGVYGHCDGALVDEDYTPNPITEMAKLRLGAEEKWLKLADDLGICGQVFRLGGIYGPGRSAVDTLIKQEALSDGQKRRESKQFTSRVHVDDICQALNASIFRSPSRKIYNIVDDDPAPREEVFEYARGLIEKKWNVKLTHDSFLKRAKRVGQIKGEKRVSNTRMKKELGDEKCFPRLKQVLFERVYI